MILQSGSVPRQSPTPISTTKTANLMMKIAAVVSYLLTTASLGHCMGAVRVELWYLMSLEEVLVAEVAKASFTVRIVAK